MSAKNFSEFSYNNLIIHLNALEIAVKIQIIKREWEEIIKNQG